MTDKTASSVKDIVRGLLDLLSRSEEEIGRMIQRSPDVAGPKKVERCEIAMTLLALAIKEIQQDPEFPLANKGGAA